MAGEVLAGGGKVEAGLRVAVRDLNEALIGDDSAPDLAGGGERVSGGIAKARIRELGVLLRVAHQAEGDGAVAGLPLEAGGEGGDEEVGGGVAAGDGQVGEGELQLPAQAEGVLLGGRRERAKRR